MRNGRVKLLSSLFVVLAYCGTALAAPEILSPPDGSTLSGSSETFTWTADGEPIDRWRLEVGTVPDGRDIYAQSLSSTITSMLVTGLPVDGSLVYVNLKWRTDGVVSSVSYIYTAWSDAPPQNTAPVVDAGADQAIALPVDTINLIGIVSDDGLPLGTLNLTWSVLSGPDTVAFFDPTAASTTATFTTPGDYVLQLNASDTLLDTSDTLAVTVHAAPVLTTIQVTPDPAVLLAGESQPFSAAGLDQTGQPYATTPAWSATGGSIDNAGLYTAGGVTGQFETTASAESVVGQADIYIVENLGPWPTSGWDTALPADVQMDQALLEQARDYALTGGGSGMITRHGQAVLTWGDTTSRFDVNSVTKSIGSMVLGLAIKDNLVTLSDLAQTHYPAVGANPASNVATGWLDEITIQHLITQTGGFDKPAGYSDILFQPGTAWGYSDAGVNWLADTLTVVNQSDLLPVLESRILAPLGISSAEVEWTDSVHRDLLVEGFQRREINSSINISVDALARLGYLALRNGTWDGQNIIPPGFVDQMRTTVPGVTGLPVTNDIDSLYSGAPGHYGIGWWNNVDGALPNVPTDAYWGWGVGDNLLLVIPSLDIVVSRAGNIWAGSHSPSYYSVLEPFFDPIVLAATSFGNEVPTVDAGVDDSITLPTDTVNLDGTVSDDGLPDGTLDTTWSMFSGPAAVTFGDILLVDTTATFTAAGDYVLRLTASDGLASASDDVLVTVLPEPDTELPVVAITEPAAGATVSGVVTVTASATDNDSIAEVEFFAAGNSIGIDTTAPYSVFWNTVGEVDADYDITAVGRDPSGNEGGDSIMVTLDNASANNQPPVVDAGTNASITLPTSAVTLNGTAVDDGLPSGTLTTTWSVVTAPDTVSIIDAGALTTTVIFGGEGTYVLRLTADDGALSASADVTITVNAEVQDEQTFTPIADNTINGSQPTRVIGGGTDVLVHSFGPKVALVQFDLSSLSGATITAASFRFRLKSLRSGGNIDVQLIDEAWTEETVAYDNQPAFGATALTVPVTSTDVGTYVEVDVTSIVHSWADGSQPSHGMRLSSTQSINAAIDSRESATPMELVVTIGAPPVPVSVPNVVGMTQAAAEATIIAANLVVGTVTTQNDPIVPAGDVISQNPVGGTDTNSGTPVDLVVSLGPVITPPGLTLLFPEDGATLSGWLRLSADATDDVGVSSVSFAVDGTEIANLTAPPYELDWDSNTVATGTHTLLVTATDIESNETSVSATLYVDSLPAQPSPYPMSNVISGVQWAPSASIIHDALGSDNWPVTWADDGNLYTAYGDGVGFDPPAPQTLSLGIARVSGDATSFVGANIPSPSVEQFGSGPMGKKASGILMVDGVMYLWVRNANNSGEQCELAWSQDRGDTWTWNTWQFAEFGYCAFLNFGQHYAGARDSFVYMYSPDSPSAYLETDNVVLTRVPKDQITDRNAYEFFAGTDPQGDPVWTTDIASRQPVFTFAGAANRLDVTYQPTIGRYLMTLRSRAQDGGLNQFSLFEGEEPWGPWSVVYYTENWEGVPANNNHAEWGEAQHIPAKWMSADAKEFHLVFSGDDSFAVRRANLTVVPDNTPPVVNVLTPVEGAQITGTVQVSADASDNYAIQSVAFEIDGMLIGELFGAPYSFDWDSGSTTEGAHVLTAVATDTANNQSTSSVNIDVIRDTQAPTVALLTPADGATVMGDVLVSATASDDFALASVTFTAGSTTLGTVTSAPYELTWGTTGFTNGAYPVTATAVDTSGNSASDTVNVTVDNPDGPPTVTLTSPTEGATVAGTVLVAATATDDVAVASVSFVAGATPLGTLTSAPYELTWDTTTYANGAQQVTATALDTSGNSADATINVTVNNVNTAPTVDAGSDASITLPTDTLTLNGTAMDDGLPSGVLTTNWSVVTAPGTVTFVDVGALTTDVTFGGAGSYVLQLTADDGALSTSDDVTITVNSEAPVEQTFVPIADNTINGAQPTRVIGGGTAVQVHGFGPKVGLVQFDLSSLSGATVTAATFRFRLASLRAEGNMDIQLVDEAWAEDTVNYDNQPAFGATVLTVPLTFADAGTVLEVDVTGTVQSWADGSQPSHGLRLSSGAGINAAIDSRETATPMELVVSVNQGVPVAAAPTISPNGATSSTPVEVTLATTTPGASIYYTLDGSTPTTASVLYSAPFTLQASATLMARAVAPGFGDSAVSSADFIIDVTAGGDLNNYWSLDETVAGNYANSVGASAGTCISCPTPAVGLINGAQSFDGAGNVITIADDGSADWNQNDGFSVEFWMQKGNACTSREVAVGRFDGGTLMQWSTGCENGAAFFELADANGTSLTLLGSTLVDDGEWHHVVAVRDGFYNENRLYVDGSLEAAGTVSYTSGFDSNADVTIGALQDGLGNTFLDGVVDEVALHDRTMPTDMIALHHSDGDIGLHRGYAGCSAPVDTMPLGDSITNRLGYRPTLYFDLVGQGYDVNFVGSRSDNAGSGSHDRDHEGWSGFATTDIAANLDGWLSGNPPDVILLHAGTNDLDSVSATEAIAGLESVLDIIHAFDSEITVVLAQIINRQTFSQVTADYNDQIPGLAQSKIAAGHEIVVVDHESALTYPDDMDDLEHPNDTGFGKMAGVWFDGLNKLLPICSAAAPSFSTLPGTSAQVGVEYQYQPGVLLSPNGSFTLLTAPAGMQVHPDTGEIRWVPVSPGVYHIDLQVQNDFGSAVQSIDVTVP